MRSSYIENNYGSVFRALILAQKPTTVVECGVLDGYSLFYIAHAVRFNKENFGIDGHVFSYDLWGNYRFKHGDWNQVKKMLEDQWRLDKHVTLAMGDAFEIYKSFEDSTVDFLHMDVSNNGDILLKTLELWGDKISSNGMIAFEGGNKNRDLGWIKEYGFKPIRPTLFNEVVGWEYQVFEPFPGLILLWRKNDISNK